VKLNGHRHYLPGKFGSKESKKAYDALIAQWMANNRQVPQDAAPGGAGCTVGELIAEYVPFATGYYVKDGKPTSHMAVVRRALRVLMALFPKTPVSEFGPLKLTQVRATMIAQGWARKTVTTYLACVKSLFRWGTEREMVPGNVYHALQSVQGLRKGRSAARETEPVQEVHESVVEERGQGVCLR
jgi:hypothetical protein